MPNCNIIFKVGNESIPVLNGIDSSLIPSEINEDFLNLIKDSDTYNFIVNTLQEQLQGNIINSLKEGQSDDYESVISNTTAKKLAELFPTIDFPKEGLDKIKVLFVNKFNRYGKSAKVKYSATGETIYIVDNNYNNVRKVARHIKALNAINSGVLEKFSDDSDEIKTIDKILKKVKFKDVTDRQSLLLHFMSNRSSYSNIDIDGEKASFLLNQIIPSVEGVYHKRKNDYINKLVRDLYEVTKFSKGIPSITLSNLYEQLKSNKFNLSFFKDKNDFYEKMSLAKKPQEVIDFFNENLGIDISEIGENSESRENLETSENSYEILINTIFKQEPGFPYRFKKIQNNSVILESTYYRIHDTYGITYDQIQLMKITPYRKWKIYKRDKNSYFIARYQLNENSYGKEYNSIEEAKKAIDLKKDAQTFYDESLLPIIFELDKLNTSMSLNLPRSFGSFQEGNVLQIHKMSISKEQRLFDDKYAIILGNYTLNDFIDLLINDNKFSEDAKRKLINEEGKLVDNFDDLTKCAILIYKLSEMLEDQNGKYFRQNIISGEMIDDVVNQLNTSGYTYLYVDNIKKTQNYQQTRFAKLPGSPSSINIANLRDSFGQQYPIVSFWESTGRALKEVFGVNLNVMTQSEIEEQFNQEYSKQKAFIIGNEIFINSTLGSTSDLFHEYFHIIMGFMKTNDKLRPEYERLLKEVWKNTSVNDRRRIQSLYKDNSYIDKLEENFVSQFGKYVANKSGNDIKQIFKQSKGLKEATTSIFDGTQLDLQELGRHPLNTIFTRFSSEISKALQNDQNMFLDFMQSKGDQFRLSNKKTNLLKKWISEGILKETDCI